MAFNGKYKLESQENFEQLMKALGAALITVLYGNEAKEASIPIKQLMVNFRFSDDVIKKYKDISSIVEFVQNGNSFKFIYNFGSRVITNQFTIGQESEFVTFTGHRVKALAKLEGENKLVVTMRGLTAVMELSGDKMIETLTDGEVTLKKISKRI